MRKNDISPIKISKICDALNVEFFGDDITIVGCSSISAPKDNTVVFSVSGENIPRNAIAVILPHTAKVSELGCYIPCENPKHLFGDFLNYLYEPFPARFYSRSIGNNCVIDASSTIGEGTVIGHNCIIGPNVVIGNNCIVQSGTVIGENGFGYVREQDEWDAISHIGGVEIGDNVHVGNNCTIDSGLIEPTIIKSGVKIDNLVHVGHNCIVGKNSVITACAELSGSVEVGEWSWLGPNSSVKQKVKLARGTVLGVGASAHKDTIKSTKYVGSPALTIREYIKAFKR